MSFYRKRRNEDLKENLRSKLRLLLCFGMMIFLSLSAPKDAEAHSADMGGRTEGYVYDG